MAIHTNRRLRAIYTKAKAIGDLRIKVEGLQAKAEKIDRQLQTVGDASPQPENNITELKQEVKEIQGKVEHLEEKISVIQWLGIIIILGIIINIFAKPFLAAFPLELF